MKLIIAIVNNDDSAVVASALTKESFTVTKLSTTGGFLMVGNTTFLIGTEDDRVTRAKEIISKYSKTRTHETASTASFGRGLADGELGTSVTVGGAMVFVLSVDEAEKY
ncbi:MAG: cyclic-di-AMP receptor [Clostridia bacterium]|nr:cyclic-di-AMP receptor [Clostridia bacterium]